MSQVGLGLLSWVLRTFNGIPARAPRGRGALRLVAARRESRTEGALLRGTRGSKLAYVSVEIACAGQVGT